MKKVFLIVALFAVLSCSKDDSTTPNPVTQTDMASVDSKVSEFMNLYNIPGASLAISKNGKLVYVKGYGKANVAANENVTPNHRFRLASLSKSYTGIAIMKLIQDGQLTMESNVFGTGGILGNDYGTSPYNANLLNIKVKHLLQHTSGSWGSATGGDVIDLIAMYDQPAELNVEVVINDDMRASNEERIERRNTETTTFDKVRGMGSDRCDFNRCFSSSINC